MLVAQIFNVPPMPLRQLLGSEHGACADVMISGIQLDSRKVRPGDLFLALPGEKYDGRQFIEQAVANGAAAVAAEAPAADAARAIAVPLVELPELRTRAGVLAARFYRHPSRALHVVGVTGTNGKTTTSRIIAQLTRALGKPCGVIGTLGATLADDVSAVNNTTPDAVSLQEQLAQWLAQGVRAVSMEVSSHALEQGRVNGVEFATAIFTNLSHDHLDYHGSMEAYGRAKLRLFATERLQHAVINADDPFAGKVRSAVTQGVQVVTYSAQGAAADVRVVNAQFQTGGVRGELQSPWGVANFFSPLPGNFNLANLAAAVSALLLAGEDLLAVLDAVGKLQPVPGRMALVPNTLDLQVIVDYAHTPDALELVLQALRPHVSGALITVFGCGGDRDKEKRPLMGRVACALSDRVVVTSDNPRSEEPLDIMREIAVGCSGNYSLVADRAEAIANAVATARAGDCVVIAGKGHEDYQLVAGARLPFSDEAHARAALSRRMAS
jgi:UDP-N-acetylmuramoyl-L-alanyl-D-glutamate--2,6-diaminopimelate ligase